MDFTDADMRIMAQQGDASGFVRMQAGWQGGSHRNPAESIRCQRCGAAPGERCTSKRGRRIAADIHQARIDDYNPVPAPARTPGAWPVTQKGNSWTTA